ncbi:MAG: Rieske 2Fe-2S domain-containing protein [Pseudomonadales bacterium]
MPDHETLAPHPGSALPHVGTYRRVLPVSLERLYENALDWEHLPFVHADSFRSIEVLDSGTWGWRALSESATGESMTLELRLDRRCRRWITRTLSGPNEGSEIWTHAFPFGPERVDIVVDFFVPDVAPDAVEKVGRAYAGLYARLYDQDVAMMVERQRQLDIRPPAATPGPARLVLGSRDSLQFPVTIELQGRGYVITASGDRLAAVPSLCPHQLGPLGLSEVENGTVTCPWHGYRFDVFSGDCVSGQSCRLSRLPRIQEEEGLVVVCIDH